MKKQQYFKLVRRIRNKLYSWQYLPERLRVQYYINRPVEAPIGGLLVFNDYTTAYEYLSVSCEIYRCTCRDEVVLPSYCNIIGDGEYMGNCWKDVKVRPRIMPWPRNTKAFKTVTLRERIK